MRSSPRPTLPTLTSFAASAPATSATPNELGVVPSDRSPERSASLDASTKSAPEPPTTCDAPPSSTIVPPPTLTGPNAVQAPLPSSERRCTRLHTPPKPRQSRPDAQGRLVAVPASMQTPGAAPISAALVKSCAPFSTATVAALLDANSGAPTRSAPASRFVPNGPAPLTTTLPPRARPTRVSPAITREPRISSAPGPASPTRSRPGLRQVLPPSMRTAAVPRPVSPMDAKSEQSSPFARISVGSSPDAAPPTRKPGSSTNSEIDARLTAPDQVVVPLRIDCARVRRVPVQGCAGPRGPALAAATGAPAGNVTA